MENYKALEQLKDFEHASKQESKFTLNPMKKVDNALGKAMTKKLGSLN